MKTKIVEFIGRIQDGGAETLVKDYALMLDKDLFDVTILCEDYRKESNNYKTLLRNTLNCVYSVTVSHPDFQACFSFVCFFPKGSSQIF